MPTPAPTPAPTPTNAVAAAAVVVPGAVRRRVLTLLLPVLLLLLQPLLREFLLRDVVETHPAAPPAAGQPSFCPVLRRVLPVLSPTCTIATGPVGIQTQSQGRANGTFQLLKRRRACDPHLQ